MTSRPTRASRPIVAIVLSAASTLGATVSTTFALDSGQQTQQADAPAAASRRVGKIKSINGTVITLTPDSGPDINVTVQDVTRIRRIAPGESNPKNQRPTPF